jgi:hypothetical protein
VVQKEVTQIVSTLSLFLFQAAPPGTDKLVRQLTKEMSRVGDSGEEQLAMLKVVGSKAGWLIQPTDVKLGDKLGKGATATVYKSIWHGLDVAVKTIDPKLFGEDPVSHGLSEGKFVSFNSGGLQSCCPYQPYTN